MLSAKFTDYLLNLLLDPKDQDLQPQDKTVKYKVEWSIVNGSAGSGLVNSRQVGSLPALYGKRLKSWASLQEREYLKSRFDAMPAERRGIMERLLNEHDLQALPPLSEHVSDVRLIDRARLNRELLELLGKNENVLRRFDIASTRVVQPHDQQVRWQWLCIWMSLFLCSLVFTSSLNRNSFLHCFYRRSISRIFLRGAQGHVSGSTAVSQLKSCEAGLPFPIYLCAWQKPAATTGAAKLPVGVAISPLRLDIYDPDCGVESVRSEHSAASICESGQADGAKSRLVFGLPDNLKLKDAVAISGSAIEPNMTNNPALALLMDFFGARLGMWLRTCNAEADEEWRAIRRHMLLGFVVVLFSLPAFITATMFGDLSFYQRSAGVLAALVWGLFWVCVDLSIGYPTILVSHLRTLLRRGFAEANKATRSRKTTLLSVWPRIFVSDGGFYDYLGVTELLRRRCDLIIVSDAGINKGESALESLAKMCERASSEFGVRFVDLDHDSPIEFGRLKRTEGEFVPQPYIAIRIKYYGQDSRSGQLEKEGLLVFAQMAITDKDPIEIQQIRHRFPSFPDEPTSNQFYTPDQVAAYRDLGYHIGSRVCSQMERWNCQEITDATRSAEASKSEAATVEPIEVGLQQPLFREIKQRLRRSYVQACYEEYYFKDNDVWGESVWRDDLDGYQSVYPKFQTARNSMQRLATRSHADSSSLFVVSQYWLDQFTENADVRNRYLMAVCRDINQLKQSTALSQSSSSRFAIPVGELTRTGAILAEILLEGLNESEECFGWDEIARNKNLVVAHFSVLAASCQQLHRGVPHALFQVGGRVKLFGLVNHLVDDLIGLFNQARAADNWPVKVEDVAKVIVHEIFELTDSVFQSAELVATISFAQCLCKELGVLLKECIKQPATPLATDQQTGIDLGLDFRQILMDRLQLGYRTGVCEVIAVYLYSRTSGQPCRFSGREANLTRVVSGSAMRESPIESSKPM